MLVSRRCHLCASFVREMKFCASKAEPRVRLTFPCETSKQAAQNLVSLGFQLFLVSDRFFYHPNYTMFVLRTAIQRLLSSPLTLTSSRNSNLNAIQIRTKVIYHLPRPSETKRYRKLSFKQRVKTPVGRRYIMERMLRGDKIVSQ